MCSAYKSLRLIGHRQWFEQCEWMEQCKWMGQWGRMVFHIYQIHYHLLNQHSPRQKNCHLLQLLHQLLHETHAHHHLHYLDPHQLFH